MAMAMHASVFLDGGGGAGQEGPHPPLLELELVDDPGCCGLACIAAEQAGGHQTHG
jgi:hypothetical protein